jgi:hypothetical protein
LDLGVELFFTIHQRHLQLNIQLALPIVTTWNLHQKTGAVQIQQFIGPLIQQIALDRLPMVLVLARLTLD